MSACDQNSSDTFIYCLEAKDDKVCMSSVLFTTENMEITNKNSPKTLHCIRLRLRIVTEENLDFVNCKYNEHYEQVKKTPNVN